MVLRLRVVVRHRVVRDHEDGQDRLHAVEAEALAGLVADDVLDLRREAVVADRGCGRGEGAHDGLLIIAVSHYIDPTGTNPSFPRGSALNRDRIEAFVRRRLGEVLAEE